MKFKCDFFSYKLFISLLSKVIEVKLKHLLKLPFSEVIYPFLIRKSIETGAVIVLKCDERTLSRHSLTGSNSKVSHSPSPFLISPDGWRTTDLAALTKNVVSHWAVQERWISRVFISWNSVVAALCACAARVLPSSRVQLYEEVLSSVGALRLGQNKIYKQCVKQWGWGEQYRTDRNRGVDRWKVGG